MPANDPKRTYRGWLANVRFTPDSGHWDAQERVGLKKRTFNVRFTPESRRKWLGRWMSAYDPKPTMVVRYTENLQARRGAMSKLAAKQGRI